MLDPKDETQELSGQAASDWWPPKAAYLIPAERGVFRPVQGQAEGLDWAIWGEPSESGLPSWDTVTITHEVRSQEGSSAWHRSTGCPGNDKTPVLQF